MNCFKCGGEYYAEDKYCPNCGLKLDENLASPFRTQVGLNVEDVRSNLGTVYFKMGKYDKAKEEFNKILKQNPENANALEMMQKISQAENQHSN